MKYHKELDIEFEHVVQPIRKYLETFHDYLKVDFVKWLWADNDQLIKECPSLKQLFDPMGLTIKKVFFPKLCELNGRIHIDSGDANLRINIPILNCDLSTTEFYESSKDPTFWNIASKGIHPDVQAYDYDPQHCTLVDSFVLRKPTIINVKQPHQVIFKSYRPPRISCSVEFHEDLTSLF